MASESIKEDFNIDGAVNSKTLTVTSTSQFGSTAQSSIDASGDMQGELLYQLKILMELFG